MEKNKKNSTQIVFSILFELATGKLNWDRNILQPEDEWSVTKKLLNNLTDHLGELINKKQIKSPYFVYDNGFLFAILVDHDLSIIDFSQNLPDCLEYSKEELINLNVRQVFEKNQKENNDEFINCINQKKEGSHLLSFMAKNKEIIRVKTFISYQANSNNILLCAGNTLQKEIGEVMQLKKNNLYTDGDIEKVKSICEYIHQNWNLPLPNTRELAKKVNTNEFTLKKLFREHCNTSIYQFYNNQRLEKAHAFIQQSNLSFLEIALNSGFSDYHSFLTAFKKKFKYTPSQIKRPNQNFRN